MTNAFLGDIHTARDFFTFCFGKASVAFDQMVQHVLNAAQVVTKADVA
jgi:hypothetical protein